MTDTTTGAAAPAAAPATPNVFAQIEATLAADWKTAGAIFQQAEAFIGQFLVNVAQGAEIVIADVEAVGQYVAAHLGIITAGIASLSTVASTVAPNSVSAQKLLADLSTGAQDLAAMSNDLTSGQQSAGDPAIVTKATTAITAAKQLTQMVNNAGVLISTLAANSPTATQAVT